MRAFVTILSPEEFQKWLDDQVQQAAATAADPFK
jgi:heme/copper-type cytochrome/quinol oxidase subunit 2